MAVHGTGTPLGDPIEMGALGQALSSYSASTMHRIAIGSVKSCYGHTEGAAGLTGTLQTLQAMNNQASEQQKCPAEDADHIVAHDILELRLIAGLCAYSEFTKYESLRRINFSRLAEHAQTCCQCSTGKCCLPNTTPALSGWYKLIWHERCECSCPASIELGS